MGKTYHPLFINSRQSGEKVFPWGSFETRILHYYNQYQAVYVGAEYQSWTQKWSQDESSLSGLILNLGFKTGF